jgi:hypothetical protein
MSAQRFPGLAAWHKRGDTTRRDQLWRVASWEAAATDLHRQGCSQRAEWLAGIARVIAVDEDYFPGDDNDRTAPNGERTPGPMERRGRLSKRQFRELLSGRRAARAAPVAAPTGPVRPWRTA